VSRRSSAWGGAQRRVRPARGSDEQECKIACGACHRFGLLVDEVQEESAAVGDVQAAPLLAHESSKVAV
jgi:hypothetical protein